MSNRNVPMPIKRLYVDDGDTHKVMRVCPVCDEVLMYLSLDKMTGLWLWPIARVIPTNPKYCPYCGQRLNWEETDN